MIAVTLAIAGATTSVGTARVAAPQPKVAKNSERCGGAIRAVRFYRGVFTRWQGRMALSGPQDAILWHCSHLRRAVVAWRERAAEARRTWHREFAWWEWLPDKFSRVGACETGYGKRPGRWDWDSGRYVSAFGIYRPAFAQFARLSGVPTWDDPGRRTPREQYRVAAAIQARYGWGAWGCGGA